MAELIGCRECESPSCKGCNIKILADMLNHGKLNALMNKNRRIDGSVDAAPVVHGEWIYNKDTGEIRCNLCNALVAVTMYEGDIEQIIEVENFCFNCGAKMGGGAE